MAADNRNRHVQRVEIGDHVEVKAHRQVIAELVPPRQRRTSQFERLVATCVITPPAEAGDPLEDCPAIYLPRGTATALIDSDRDEE